MKLPVSVARRNRRGASAVGKNASALRPRERGGKSCHRAARSQRGHSAAEISLLDRSAVKKNHFSLSAGFISQRGAEIPAKNRKIRFIHVMTAYDVMALFWERNLMTSS